MDAILKELPENSNFECSFFGGEPLLEYKKMFSIIDNLEQQFPKINFSYSITTNATLINEEIIKKSIDKKIDYHVSIDGSKEVHDNKRKFSKSGSWNLVLPRVEMLISNGIAVTAEFTMEPNYLYDITQHLENLKKIGIKKISLKTNHYSKFDDELKDNKDLHNCFAQWYISNFKNIRIVQIDKILKRIDNVNNKIENVSFCNAGDSTLTISTDGKIYPCHACPSFSNHEKFGSSKPFDLNHKLFNILSKEKPEVCIDCEIKNLCFGTCIFINKETNNDFLTISSDRCKYLKFLVNTSHKIYESLKEDTFFKKLMSELQSSHFI